jgi:Zn-dependent peptidase ImmA (M78 family)
MLAPKQIRRLDSLVAAKRARHVELRRPITSAGLRAVLRREGVLVKVLPHPRDAELLAIEGRWVIIVNEAQPNAERLVAVAHEYGHFMAHVDSAEPRTYDASPPWYD